jgi:hypothetical protein
VRLSEEIAERYVSLEERFAGEPLPGTGPAPEEQAVRERIATLQGYELSKIECRYTMCRLEVMADNAGAAGMLFRLGFKEGGEVRRLANGTFLLFAGRDGFPFQETNRVD